jgi:tetratricopeptide (TPR) repeat protein
VLGTKIEDQLPQLRGGYAWVIRDAHIEIDWAAGNFAALDADSQEKSLSVSERYALRARIAAALHDEPLSRDQLVSSAAGDWPEALSAAKALVEEATAEKASAPGPDWAGEAELALQTVYRPRLAYAELMTKDAASATALMAQSPEDCYLCVQVRAQIAEVAGDPAGADRRFAYAVRQAPDLPMAYLQWGQTLLARGDLTGAAKQLAFAQEKGPRFADPLKALGDVLVKQRRPKEAQAKYDEALKYAPNWAALKGARAALSEKT